MERLSLGDVRLGSRYEAERADTRTRLAAEAEQRRVSLGADLVLVFETAETVRVALEEALRAERASSDDRLAPEAAAFAELLGGEHHLVATLYIDAADPVVLADRLAELAGVEQAVYLEAGGRRTAASDGDGDSAAGAFHLVFALDDEQRASLLSGGAVLVGVEHRACRASVVLSPEQLGVIAADLRG